MKNYRNNIYKMAAALPVAGMLLITGCTKYENGFISPTMQYAVSEFTVTKGHIASSNTIVADGSNLPLNIKWTHVHDENGKLVDSLFGKKYTVGIWTSVYDNKVDTSFSLIMAKRGTEDMEPIVVNATSGVLEANPGTYYLPTGTYTMDLEATNVAGTVQLPAAMKITILDGKSVETTPETGNYSLGRLNANTSGSPANSGIFNGVNNPYVVETIERLADTPNTMLVKVLDRFGTPFKPSKGEVAKRPASGLNPVPPFLQNLEYYSPDTYQALDEGMFIKFPITPFPITSLGNGFNMYYRIPTAFVHIDSTSTWSSNTDASVFYQGTADSHYKGVFKDDLYDFSMRIPLRIQVPGSYVLTIKLLDVTHR